MTADTRPPLDPPSASGAASRPGGEAPTRVWHLVPVDLQAPAWAASVYKGPVVVRAESEQRARELARDDFSSSGLPVATMADPPWTQPGVVRAEPVDGDPEILELS